MIDPSNPPKNRVPQTQEVTILLTLEIPTNLDTSLWPVNMVLDGMEASTAWGFLDGMVLSGKALSASDSHILVFDIPEDQDMFCTLLH